MPRFDVTAPNGKVFRVDAPEGATEEQAIAYVATDVYPRFLEENKPKPERGIGQLFTQGVGRGFAQTGVLLGDYLPAMVGRGVEAAGEATGIGAVQEAGKSFAERQLREAAQSELDIAKKYPREFESYEQVTGPVSAARYAAEALGEGLPSLLPGIATGGVGAIAARGVASAAGRAAATFGATAAGSAAQTVPEAYASLLKETGKEEIGTALVAGGINAALESVMPASVLSKMSGPARDALVGSVKRRLGLGFAEGAAVEGLTEGMQEAVNKAAVTFVDENKEFFTSENWKQILDSSIRGAIVGGTVSGATNVAFGRQEQPTPGSGKPIDEVLPPEGQQPTPTEPTPTGPTPTEPTAAPTPEPTPTEPTPTEPTAAPTPEPTAAPTPEPTAAPTPEPAAAPTPEPTATEPTPTPEPTPTEPTPTPEPTPTEPTAAPTPEPTAPDPFAPQNLPVFNLPKQLAGAKPKFNFGTASFSPEFVNGIDKALFITAQASPSKANEEYREFLRQQGFSNEDILAFGKAIRTHIRSRAAASIEAGQSGGPLPIDFMRTEYPGLYTSILSGKSPAAPTPAAPTPAAPTPAAPTPAAPTPAAPTPAAPTPAAPTPAQSTAPVPLIPVEPGFTQDPATVIFHKNAEFELEGLVKGLPQIIRTLVQGMFPGSRFMIVIDKNLDAYGASSSALGTNRSFLYLNPKALLEGTGGNKSLLGARLLKTLFHELSHPIEKSHVQDADPKTFQAIMSQYVRERNPDSAARFALMEAFRKPSELKDPKFLTETLKAMGMTPQQYAVFKKNKDKNLGGSNSAMGGVSYTSVGGNYQRSFTEWVAEKGAAWFTKELNNIVPKTVFEQFQKSVLTRLRSLYRQVAKMLGIPSGQGAFGKLLKEVYGRKKSIGLFKGNVEPGSRPGSKAIIPYPKGSLLSTGMLGQVGMEPTFAGSGTLRLDADAITTAKGPDATFVKSWKDVNDLTSRGDESMTGMVGGFMRRLTGANPGESYGRAFARNVVNSNIPFLERAELRNLGKLIEGMMNASGRVMGLVTIGPMGYSQANKNFFYHTGKDANGLLDIFREIGTKNADQAQKVFLAMREQALRRDKIASQGALSPLPPGITRLSDQELQNIIDSADPAVRRASERFQKFNDRMIEMSIQTGLIPRELGEKFKTMMYIPMYRLQKMEMDADPNSVLAPGIYDAMRGPTGMNAFTKKVGELAVGGPVYGNLYENILSNYNAIVSAAVRNVAYQETAKTLTKLMRDGGDTTIAEVFDNKPAEVDSVRFRIDGQDKYLVIHDPAMFQAVAALSPQQKGAFIKAASRFTDLLRKGVTAAPPFQLRNLIRGLVELKVKTGMPVFEILRGTLDGARDTLKKGDGYRDIVGRTGFGGFGFGSGAGDMSNYMNRVYKEKELSWGEWQKYPNAFARLFDRLEGLGEVTEMAPRIAYYNYLRRQGMSDQDAAWEAVNLVNYHRHGTGNGILGNVVSNLIPLTPFLTARIQGLYRLVESGTAGAPTNLVGKGFVGIPAAIVSRGLMVMAINAGLNMMYGDEDWYKKLSVKDRLANMYVKVGDVVIALPRAYEVGELFGALPTLVLDSIRKENGSDIASGVGQFMMKTFLIEPVPQVVKPLVELYANKNFFTGLPIENLSDKRSPKEERFDEYTSSFSKMAGQVTKYVELSPKQVDTLIRGYLGTMSTLFLGTVDSLMGSAGTKPQGVFGDPNSVAGVVGNITGVSSILKTESQLNNKFVGDFYEIKDKVTQIVTSMNDAAIRRDTDAVKARLEQMPQAKAIYTAFNSTAARLTEVNRQMDAIRGQKDMPPERKTELLERLRTIKGQLAQQAVQAAERAGVTR